MESRHWYTCENCGKNLSSYHSLWRHRKNTCISKHIGGKQKVSDTTGSFLNRIVNDSSPKSSERARNKEDIITDGEPSTPNRCIIKIEEEAEEEGDDELSPQPTVKFLPPTTAGLWKRFHTIYPEQKEKNRNELVSILDNLLRLGGICRKDYLRYNDTISGGDLFPGIVEYNLATGSGLYLQPYFR